MKGKSIVFKGKAARKLMAAAMVSEHGAAALGYVTGPMKEAVQAELSASGKGGAK